LLFLLLEEKMGAQKSKNVKKIFLLGRPPLCGSWRRVSVGFAFWIYVSDLVK